ncbi:cellobiose transport system substrate-binding protein [Enterococcus sp. AZ194]|uniref:ABC transporter substrate-binding protein n=1 Tax=Enterococcus sp. AZ194 TaxID=2774629 RepID=UPI003F27265D
MKKRVLVILLSALGLFVTGCGSSSAKDDGKVNLTIWYYQNSMSDNVISGAKEEFSDYNLEFKKLPSDGYETKIDTSLNSGNGPDIAMMFSMTPYYKYSDKFINLLDYDAESKKKDYLDWKWDLGTTPDGKALIAMPVDIGPMGLFYREDIFKEAGLPNTPEEVSKQINDWDTYFAAAKQVKEKTDAYMFDSALSIFNTAYLQQDKFNYDRDGKLIVDDGHIKKVWDLAIKAIDEGLTAKVPSGSAEWAPAMNSNKIASMPGASWQRTNVSDAAPDTSGKWRVAMIPGGSANYGGSFMSAFKASKHPKEAVEVLNYLVSIKSQEKNYSDLNIYPSTPALYSEKVMDQPEEFFGGQNTNEYLSKSAEAIKTVYVDPREAATLDAIVSQLKLVESQGKNSDDAWKDAVSEATSVSEQ